MPLAIVASAISAAVADRDAWAWWVDASSIVVIAGVVAESVAEIRWLTKLARLDKDEDKRKAIERLGLFALILGLVGEFAFGIPVHNDTVTIETALSDRVTAASGRIDRVAEKTNAVGTAAGLALTNAADASNEASNAADAAGTADTLAKGATAAAGAAKTDAGVVAKREAALRLALDADEADITRVKDAAAKRSLQRFGVVLAMQKYRDTHFLIVDNGASDFSTELLATLQSARLPLVDIKTSLGIADMTPTSGIVIEYMKANTNGGVAAKALCDELWKQGLDVTDLFGWVELSADHRARHFWPPRIASPDAVVIVVGSRLPGTQLVPRGAGPSPCDHPA